MIKIDVWKGKYFRVIKWLLLKIEFRKGDRRCEREWVEGKSLEKGKEIFEVFII